jgi:hypothetical protein
VEGAWDWGCSIVEAQGEPQDETSDAPGQDLESLREPLR